MKKIVLLIISLSIMLLANTTAKELDRIGMDYALGQGGKAQDYKKLFTTLIEHLKWDMPQVNTIWV